MRLNSFNSYFIQENTSEIVYNLPMCNLMLEPRSLQQLSIKVVHKYRDQLPWRYLPKKLIKLMQYGSNEDTIGARDSPPEAD